MTLRYPPTREPMMEGNAERDDRLLEAMEACRSGRHDLSDPALAFLVTELAADPELDSLFERGQRLDAVLGQVFRDVPVPEGLEDRLLARLSDAREPGSAVSASPLPLSEPKTTTVASRRWWIGASLAAAAAALVIGVSVFLRAPAGYSESEALQAAIAFYNDEAPETGQLVSVAAPPAAFPFSRNVRRIQGMRWRTIRGLLGREGVAYDLPGPGQARATLYVLPCRLDGAVPTAPPLHPALTTAGRATATWQSDGLLYLLVVDGGGRAYRGFLDLPTGPIT